MQQWMCCKVFCLSLCIFGFKFPNSFLNKFCTKINSMNYLQDKILNTRIQAKEWEENKLKKNQMWATLSCLVWTIIWEQIIILIHILRSI